MDLFAHLPRPQQRIGAGAVWLPGFADASQVLPEIEKVTTISPFRQMTTAGGRPLSVEMTNCGAAGWISDQLGYRYVTQDPQTDRAWPEMPNSFRDLAVRAAEVAGYPAFDPDCCLINRYPPGSRLGLHQDRDEKDFSHPIVSVSVGLPCNFAWGGQNRNDETRNYRLESGDVVVFGGPDRLTYHGVTKVVEGDHPLTGRLRYNLTFRKTG